MVSIAIWLSIVVAVAAVAVATGAGRRVPVPAHEPDRALDNAHVTLLRSPAEMAGACERAAAAELRLAALIETRAAHYATLARESSR